MAGYKRPYTRDEELDILRYICFKKAYYQLRGNVIWRQMEEEGVIKRTEQSMKEHFRKQMVGKLNKHYYQEIDKEELQKIRLGYESTAVGANYRREYRPQRREADLSRTPPESDDSD